VASLFRRLNGSLIPRGAHHNFVKELRPWLKQLIDFKFSQRKNSPKLRADILHLLRGAGPPWTLC